MKLRAAALLLFVALAPLLRAQSSCPNPQATLVAPANGSTNVASPVTYSWNAVSGALGYEVWASFDGDDPTEVGGTSDTALVVDVNPGTQVEWYVVTNFSDCKTESTHFKFATASCPTGLAKLLTPADGAPAVSSPVQFTWTPVDAAAGYRLYIAKGDGDFQVWDETDQTSSTIHLEPGTYFWGIETFFDTCESTISDVSQFTIPQSPNCPTTGADLLTPADGSNATTNVHFSWAPVAGAINYQVWAALDDGDFNFIDETSGTSIDTDLGTGHVTWVVVAQFSGCDDALSRDGEFDIPFDPECDNDSPYLISPADGDTDVPLKVNFIWTPVYGATSYRVWVQYGGADPQMIGTTTDARLSATLSQAGEVTWFVETTFASCPSDESPTNTFTASASAVCKPPEAPQVYVDSEAMSGQPYVFIWSPGLNTSSYEVQESTTENFSGAVALPSSDIFVIFQHDVAQPTRYFYRVRSLSSCGLGTGPFSDAASIVVLPTASTDAAASFGSQNNVVQTVHVSGGSAPQAFTATVDQPWLTITPTSGTLPPSGIDFTLTADPKTLPVGSSTATIRVLTQASGVSAASKRINDNPPGGTSTVPISVNLVTSVSPNAGNPPIPSSLIIPLLAHTSSTHSQSDIRIANLSAQTLRYQLNFTPSGVDGTKVGQQVTMQVNAGETAALNDVLKNFFGYAAANDNVTGVLEIRPLTTGGSPAASATSVTIATSRTYSLGASGTNGTFVPALPLTQFISKSKDPAKPAVLNLQQIGESASLHTSLGFVEAAGEPATVQIAVFGDHGESLGTYSVDLKPGEQRDVNDFFTSKGLQIADGRVEATVTSATGKVTVYASVTDTGTGAPVLITPDSAPAATREVLPGVADFTNVYAKWRSDLRLYNASAAPASVTITFNPQADTPRTATVSLAPAEVRVIPNAVQSLFSMQNAGGSVVVTSASNIVASARTYNQTATGGVAQFIPAVTNVTALGIRPLQLVQLEESDRFRTNVGIAEVGGSPATVEISAVTPELKVAVKTQVTLQANEFMQVNRILAKFGLPTTYNARVSLKVISGTGRIAGYASMIDNRTQSPTYIPAQ